MKLQLSRLRAGTNSIIARRCAALIAAAAIAGGGVGASRRPHYGGTLHVEIAAAVASLDPPANVGNATEIQAKREIDSLIYEKATADGSLGGIAGSGPFRISEWQPGRHLSLAANEDFSGGRPFVDRIEIEMGRSVRDRLTDLQLDRTDITEIPPELARQVSSRGVQISVSPPNELIAIVFTGSSGAVDEPRLRQALALSIDRAAIVEFILQKQGEPAGALLPQWSSGTAFLFPTVADPARAKEIRAQLGASPQIRLGYDSSDPLEESIAERVAVNAREVGIAIVVQGDRPDTTGARENARLLRLPMTSGDPAAAMVDFAETLNATLDLKLVVPTQLDVEQIVALERLAMDKSRIVPLVWVPRVYGLNERVRDWQAPATGESWPLADVWLDPAGAPASSQN